MPDLMPHTESSDYLDFCKEHPFQAFFFGCMFLLILSPLFLSLLFDSRYTKAFAVRELQSHEFEQVVVLEKYSIGSHVPFLNTTENWFDFMAVKDKESVNGRLICYIVQFWKLRKEDVKLN